MGYNETRTVYGSYLVNIRFYEYIIESVLHCAMVAFNKKGYFLQLGYLIAYFEHIS